MSLYSGSVAAGAVEGLIVGSGDRCTIYAPQVGVEGTLDPETGVVTFPDRVVLWEGPCLVQAAASSVEQAGTRTTEETIRVPASVDVARIGDLIEVDRWPGAWFEIIRIPSRSVRLSIPLAVRRSVDVPGPGVL